MRERTGFVIDRVPPASHAERMKTFIDEDLLRHDVTWAAAGTTHAAFALRLSNLQALTGGADGDIKQ